MEDRDLEFLNKWDGTIRQMIINQSLGVIPVEFREGVTALGKKYGMIDCLTCSRSFMRAVVGLYELKLKTINQREANKKIVTKNNGKGK